MPSTLKGKAVSRVTQKLSLGNNLIKFKTVLADIGAILINGFAIANAASSEISHSF
jgi:hypothetical protein